MVEVHAETLATRELLAGEGAPVGVVTSALQVGGRLYLAGALADRIGWLPMPRTP